MNKKIILIITLLIVVIGFFSASLFYQKQQSVNVVKQASSKSLLPVFDRGTHPVYGDPTAKVTLTEFFDPACETCAYFAPEMKKMVDSYQGRVKIVYRYLPLHQGADDVIRLIEASRAQNKFKETLSLLFSTLPQWTVHHVVQFEKSLEILRQVEGLDVDQLIEHAKSPEVTLAINQDKEDAGILSLSKTPSFFVNGKPLMRFGLQQLNDLVAQEVKSIYGE
jgi:protein-disulfide isomerase